MSRPLEHDYIGLSEVSSMENSVKLLSPKPSSFSSKRSALKTELSLGLPGCESPERKPLSGVTIFGKDFEGNTQNGYSIGSPKGFASGAKRGFSDAIDGCEKWVFSINGKSDTNLSKDGKNFSGVENNNAQKLVSSSPNSVQEKQPQVSANENGSAPAAKAQVVGWPPIRSFRKNTLASTSVKNNEQTEEKTAAACNYVKVSMDGAPYLRKVDLQTYRNYMELSSALEKMFNCFISGQYGSNGNGKKDGMGESHSTDLQNAEYVLTYEDKDGDWMLVGDVPWRMFTENCRKLRIMKGSEAIGLAPNAAEKCKTEA
ncbi:auxin-responsive protein IAA27 [Beta vulgaris subsp. vulgaris]|uniref:auxin-responsive protein IAA27 n=1 Tax=Beta vulgaris subsp. vulgaris TaxID=3555 RepID=UPI002036AE88|nr:auxin-responsive protein IAA27 [Beta vulgaris subsp. vulgaris]